MQKYLKSILNNKSYKIEFDRIFETAIKEDLSKYDKTTQILIDKNSISNAKVIAKSSGILCGSEIAKACFKKIDSRLKIDLLKNDGDKIDKGDIIIKIRGKSSSILKVERVTLNFLQHLSGIATCTNKIVNSIKKYNTTLLDTRKTLPGLRLLEKYAVYIGGGRNHRFNLKDEVLIKENHIFSCGGIEKTLQKMKNFSSPYEIEVSNIEELMIALKYNVPVILLDNFTLKDIKKAVKINNGKAKLEVSGNVTIKNAKKIARLGVVYISVGSITHSAKAIDFSLLLH